MIEINKLQINIKEKIILKNINIDEVIILKNWEIKEKWDKQLVEKIKKQWFKD